MDKGVFWSVLLGLAFQIQAVAQSDSSATFDLNLAFGLTFSNPRIPAQGFDEGLERSSGWFNSFHGGLVLSQSPRVDRHILIGANYSRRGFRVESNEGRFLSHFVDGYAALLLGSRDGRIGPQVGYSHPVASSYRYVADGNRVNEDIPGITGRVNYGARAEAMLQPGSYLIVDWWQPIHTDNWQPFLQKPIFQVGLRINLNRRQVNRHKEERNFVRSEARRHVQALHDGVLLVRLPTLEHSIAALQERGLTETAKEMEDAIRVQNIAVMNAFRNEFAFCPVYFYYSSNAADVQHHRFAGALFTADEQYKVTHELDSARVYFATFGNLEADTASTFDRYAWVQEGDFSRQKVEVYTYPSTFNFGALKIHGPDYYQLREPFPFYVKTYGAALFKRSPFNIVRILNNNLDTYFIRARQEETVAPSP